MKKSLSCAIYLNRADNRRAGFSSSGSRVALMADPKPSFGLVVGFRLSLGPDSVNRQHRSSLDVWRPGQRQGARDEALEDYRRCKTGQALRALGQP